MAKDEANIFKLSSRELRKYKENPFFDAAPGAEDFAKSLLKDIKSKETPHILLLEGKYGIGKTFFSSRFTQFLRNKDTYTVYFSAWENDYLPDPFLAFSKALIQYFNESHPIKNFVKDSVTFPIQIVKNLAKSLTFGGSMSVGIPFVAEAEASVDCDVEKLFNAFSRQSDPVVEFKKEFVKFVKTLKAKRLVIIVDELDRCRPDYAMKVLEITKHFFDMEGVFVIIPTNKIALKRSLEALYGIKMDDEDHNPQIESYYKKFFNDEREILAPNYLKMVEACITKEALSKAFERNYIIEDRTSYNDFQTLVIKVADYSKQGNFSLRQTKDICKETVRICNHFFEPVKCEYLAYLMCNKEKNKKKNRENTPLQLNLNDNHPFYINNYGKNSKVAIFELKEIMLNIRNYLNNLKSYNIGQLSTTILNEIRNKYHNLDSRNPTNFSDLYLLIKNEIDFLEECSTKVKGQSYVSNPEFIENISNTIIPFFCNKKQEAFDFQKKYGTDDNDHITIEKYKKIVAHPEILYEYNS